MNSSVAWKSGQKFQNARRNSKTKRQAEHQSVTQHNLRIPVFIEIQWTGQDNATVAITASSVPEQRRDPGSRARPGERQW